MSQPSSSSQVCYSSAASSHIYSLLLHLPPYYHASSLPYIYIFSSYIFLYFIYIYHIFSLPLYIYIYSSLFIIYTYHILPSSFWPLPSSFHITFHIFSAMLEMSYTFFIVDIIWYFLREQIYFLRAACYVSQRRVLATNTRPAMPATPLFDVDACCFRFGIDILFHVAQPACLRPPARRTPSQNASAFATVLSLSSAAFFFTVLPFAVLFLRRLIFWCLPFAAATRHSMPFLLFSYISLQTIVSYIYIFSSSISRDISYRDCFLSVFNETDALHFIWLSSCLDIFFLYIYSS